MGGDAFLRIGKHYSVVLCLIAIIGLGGGLLCFYGVDVSPVFGVVTLGVVGYSFVARVESRFFPLILFLTSFCLCLFVIVLLQTPQVSDFKTQYESALEFAAGNWSAYHNDYYLNWSWQTGWSLIQSWLLMLWRSMACIKVFEALCTSCMVLLAYCCASELFERKTARFIGAALAFFPSFVLMCGVLSNQVLSALFCMLAIYVFITKRIPFSKRWIIGRLFLCGTFLALAWFVRPDATVVLVAIAPALIVSQAYSKYREGFKSLLNRLFNVVVLVVSYFLISSLLSFSIVAAGINPEGVSNHDPLIKVALGTNPDNAGGWSASLFERIQEKESQGTSYEDAEIEVIRENLSDPVTVIEMYIGKNHQFWWNLTGFVVENQMDTNPQFVSWTRSLDKSFALGCFVLCLLSLWRFKKKGFSDFRYTVFPSLIVFTVAAYQIVEAQPRYSYFVYIIMFILMGGGIEVVRDVLQRIVAGSRNEICVKNDPEALSSSEV